MLTMIFYFISMQAIDNEKFELSINKFLKMQATFKKKVEDAGWILDIDVGNEEWFKTHMDFFKNYGRDVELLFSYVKVCHGRRLYGKSNEIRKQINIIDLNKGYEQFNKNKSGNDKHPALIGLYV